MRCNETARVKKPRAEGANAGCVALDVARHFHVREAAGRVCSASRIPPEACRSGDAFRVSGVHALARWRRSVEKGENRRASARVSEHAGRSVDYLPFNVREGGVLSLSGTGGLGAEPTGGFQ